MNISVWVQAARPKTLPLSLCPAIIGSALAFKAHPFNPWTFLFTLLTALGIQIGTNMANDYYDFLKGSDTASRKGPLRVMQAGLVNIPTMKKALILVFGATALSGTYLIWQGGVIIALLVALSLLLAVVYTGGPFPLAYLGLAELFVFPFFGPIAVAGAYYLQTGFVTLDALIAGIVPGAISCAVVIMNNLRDIDEDRLAKKRTLIVRFGKRFGQCEYLFFLLLAVASSFYLSPINTIIFLPAIPLIREVFTQRNPVLLIPILEKTAQLLLAYTLLFCFIS